VPLAAAIPTLANGFLPLFEPGQATTAGAARVWANAYFSYTVLGNVIPPPPKKNLLEAALTAAFNPELNGGGRSLFLQALTSYWLGIPATVPPGTVSIFIPSGSIDSSAASDATPQQQAKALADLIHQLTIRSAKVVPTVPGPPVPVT